uniref:Uncharacterized protein n=1 Tax=Cucumis melo TaxID=3656 RepID=A0A9I9EBD3_CUCME
MLVLKANAIFSSAIHLLSASNNDFIQNYYVYPLWFWQQLVHPKMLGIYKAKLKGQGLDDFSILEEFEYYVMRYMREIVSKNTSIITDAICFSNVIDTRNSYSQLELDELQVEWAEFLALYITLNTCQCQVNVYLTKQIKNPSQTLRVLGSCSSLSLHQTKNTSKTSLHATRSSCLPSVSNNQASVSLTHCVSHVPLSIASSTLSLVLPRLPSAPNNQVDVSPISYPCPNAQQ